MKEGEIPGITAIGAYTPVRTISNSYIAERLGKSPELLQRLMRRIGIDHRHWVDENTATSDLAIKAVNDALDMVGESPAHIKAIWLGTMSSDYLGVPIAPKVQEKVGAPNLGVYVDLGAACAGFIHALHTTYTNITSPYGLGSPQIAVGADVLSKHLSPKQKETYVLFGDAAGAVVIRNVPDKQGIASKIVFQFGADGSHAEDLCILAGGSKNPTSKETLELDMHYLKMNGPLVKEHAINRMAECVEIVKERAGLSYNDISLFIPHQANLEIIDGVAKTLGFPTERVYKNINRYGNTSAASIPIAMKDAYNEGKLDPDELILVASFGAGFEFAAATISTSGLLERTAVGKVRAVISRLTRRTA